MFNSPIESYNAHYKIDIDLGFLLTAARNTHEAIVAIETGDLSGARQKWESVDGEASIGNQLGIELITRMHSIENWSHPVLFL